MNKKEKLEALDKKLEALHVRQKEIDQQLADYSLIARKYIDIPRAKKSGNVFFIIAAIVALFGVLLIVVNPDEVLGFSLLAGFYICGLLIPGIIMKTKGLKKARKLQQEIDGIDIEDIFEKERRLNSERDSVNAEIYKVETEKYSLLKYHGKEWRLTEIDPQDSATMKALVQDLYDVVYAILNSKDELFISNNWLINNIMLYFNTKLSHDDATVERYDTVLSQMCQGTSWEYQLINMLILGGFIRMMGVVYEDPDCDDWDQIRKTARLRIPDTPDAVAFYADTITAADKAILLVGEVLRSYRK